MTIKEVVLRKVSLYQECDQPVTETVGCLGTKSSVV